MKITRYLTALLLLLSLPSIAAETPGSPAPQTIKITADSEQYSFDDGLFHALGNVRITCGEMYLTADKVSGSVQTGSILATGSVRFVRETMTLTADQLSYTFPAGVKPAEAESRFHAKGNVTIEKDSITLKADEIEGSPSAGDVEATGNVTFKDSQRTLTGDTFKYNFKTNTGDATNTAASVPVSTLQKDEPSAIQDQETANLYFKGEALKASPERYELHNATFTTCNLEHPHYCFSAGELTVEPGKKFTARNVSVNALGKRLFTLPYYSAKLSKGGEKSKKTLPMPGYSDEDGVFIAFRRPIVDDDRNSADANIRLSTKHLIQGGIMYDMIDAKPVFARLTYKEPYYSGSQSNTMLSRYPEIGIRYTSGSSAKGYEGGIDPLGVSGATIDPAQFAGIIPDRHMNSVVEIGAGRFTEYPNVITNGRAEMRALIFPDAIPLDNKTYLMPGVLARTSFYDNGDSYTTAGASFALARSLGPRSFASLTYLTQSVGGHTPFTFDKLDMANELAARLIFPSGDFSLDILTRFNLSTSSVYDFQISVSKPVHCLQPKIIWKNRAREIGFEVGLAGF